jgi:hypothetical protein
MGEIDRCRIPGPGQDRQGSSSGERPRSIAPTTAFAVAVASGIVGAGKPQFEVTKRSGIGRALAPLAGIPLRLPFRPDFAYHLRLPSPDSPNVEQEGDACGQHDAKKEKQNSGAPAPS